MLGLSNRDSGPAEGRSDKGSPRPLTRPPNQSALTPLRPKVPSSHRNRGETDFCGGTLQREGNRFVHSDGAIEKLDSEPASIEKITCAQGSGARGRVRRIDEPISGRSARGYEPRKGSLVRTWWA
jgi:hypothetical protein